MHSDIPCCCPDHPSSDTKAYIGAKIVQACPMTRAQFRAEVRPDFPSDRDDQPGYLVIYEDGYHAWSPQDVFERSYRELIPSEKALVR